MKIVGNEDLLKMENALVGGGLYVYMQGMDQALTSLCQTFCLGCGIEHGLLAPKVESSSQ